MRIRWLTLILFVLVLLVITGIVFLTYQTQTTSTFESPEDTQTISTKRGWKQTGTTSVFYQFPAVVLSNVRLEDDMYKIKISPFNSIKEEFDLHIGLATSTIAFGNCSFDETGQLTGPASWTNQSVKQVIKNISQGNTILIRLTYPTDPIGDQIEYTIELKKRIDSIEQGENLDFLFASSFCKQT